MSNETHPSLCPPPHGYPPPEDKEDPPPSWVLLDVHAYVADRENATSAYAEMSNGEAIRVTFCTAPPPLVSYFCVWCPNLPPTELAMEPIVHAAEADLVLFHVSLSGNRSRRDYFVYKAPSGGKGPLLWRLEKPDAYLSYRHNAALIAHRNIVKGGCINPHGDGDDRYYIATLSHDLTRLGSFNLWLYNSMNKKWTSSSLSLGMMRVHRTAKVITLGEGCLLGFVDPWQGILVCTMLGCRRMRYLPLPQHLIRPNRLQVDPMFYRDVAFVNGRLTLVELHRSTSNPDGSPKCPSYDVSTWSISSPWEEQESWQMDYMINTHNIIVNDDTANVDLLPTLQDNGSVPRPALGRLHFAHPTLSLSNRHTVYLMGKVGGHLDRKTIVLSFDMRKPRLQGAAVFNAERMMGYTYMQSRVSSFFNMVPGDSLSVTRKWQAVLDKYDIKLIYVYIELLLF